MTSLLWLLVIVGFALTWSRIGALKERVRQLDDTVLRLRQEVDRLRQTLADDWAARHAAQPTVAEAPTAPPTPVQAAEAASAPTPRTPPAVPPPVPAQAADSAQVAGRATFEIGREPAAGYARAAATPPRMERPDPVAVALRTAQRWLTVGNVPVKVGMLVLLAGVAALLKFGSEQGWFRLPMELRLIGIAVAALAALGFGWRKREAKPAFAQAVQGGAIGVLLLTIYAAARRYDLLPGGLAFGLSVVLVAAMCVLAVLQNARTLAVLGVLAGFLAPIWLSDGHGNHVALFSYYALFNLAIFAMAWRRPWRVLPVLGFVFTWGIGIAWGVLKYRPDLYASTQPFLYLFFFLYLLMPLLYARQRPPRWRDRLDACLLFGTPLVAFSAQAALAPQRPALAFYAVGMAAIYLALGWWMRGKERYRVLLETFAILAVAFATLAIPLAFSARVTAALFALEGAGMLWLGLRQQRRLPQVVGVLLQLLAGMAFLIASVDIAVWSPTQPLANPRFTTGALLALAGLASAWLLLRAQRHAIANLLYVWALTWGLGTLAAEIGDFVAPARQPDVWLLLACAIAAVSALGWRRWRATALVLTTFAAIAMAAPLTLWQQAAHVHPLSGLGVVGWLAFAGAGWIALRALREDAAGLGGLTQALWWLVWPWMVALVAQSFAQRGGWAQGWHVAAVAVPWLAFAGVAVLRGQWLQLPQGDAFARWLPLLRGGALLIVTMGWLSSLFLSGDPAPLPWLPLLNPLELMQLLALAIAMRWLMMQRIQSRWLLAGLAALAWVTFATLRSAHHLGNGLPWSPAMLSSSLAQMCLTVVWSVLGVVGWISGSRRSQRGLWLAGALLMAVVLAKLVLIDRGHLGNLLGIGSFIAYGLLCTVVGYFAPAPPRDAGDLRQDARA